MLVRWLVGCVVIFLAGCVSVPEGVKPVTHFDVTRYAGQWYEIARLDNRFERGLSQVTANYELLSDGTIRVVNRGYSKEQGRWKEAEGKAKFVADTSVGLLKVSFFGPFYGAYVVFELGEDYEYAFVSGPDTGYLWLLARSPSVSDGLKQRFETEAQARGFVLDDLVYVSHGANEVKALGSVMRGD